MDNLNKYLQYHSRSSIIRDIDPANDTLRYIANRFELNIEQRYWLAFLYACCYSPTTTYFMYNDFPDFENVDANRLQKWWDKNRNNLIFQTDRLRVKSSNQFVDAFISYRDMIGKKTQHEFFTGLLGATNDISYNNVWNKTSEIYTFGRFTLFIYMEMLNVLTELPIEPSTLILKDAESCRNGVALAFDLTEYNTHRNGRVLSKEQHDFLQTKFTEIRQSVARMKIEHTNVWNIETTLCAYKKHRMGKRYVGFYIDRAGKEILKMSQAITQGVDWTPLWQFREETYEHKYLFEKRNAR
jgi:hypothetical protein